VQFVQSHTPVAKAGPMGSGNLLCVHHWHPEHTIPGYVPRVLGVGHLLLWSQADMILETAPQGPETSQFLSASQAGVWQEGPGQRPTEAVSQVIARGISCLHQAVSVTNAAGAWQGPHSARDPS
jgi:hypothetical protein